MIDYIKGKLAGKTPTYAVIECAGVGYRLNISLHTYSQIEESESCKLFAHLSIKEDAHTLYGFADQQERQVFRHLIQVSGIGTNTARLMLSSMSPIEIQQAILNKKHMSAFAGHQQGRNIAYGRRADGKEMTAIICGSCYEHNEDYLGEQGNHHFRGLYLLHNIDDGSFDECAVPLHYITENF